MHLLVFLSERDFDNMVRSSMIVNCLVTFSDVKNAKLIFGPDITSLKGKSVRRKTASVVTDYIEIPREILKSRKELEVSTDIIFINKLSIPGEHQPTAEVHHDRVSLKQERDSASNSHY